MNHFDQALLRRFLDDELTSEEATELETRLEQEPDLAKMLDHLGGPTTEEISLLASLQDTSTSKEVCDLIDDIKKQISDHPADPVPSDWTKMLEAPEETDAPDVLGRVGEFLVLEHLSTGGMAHVFRARDPKLKREVALKVLSPAIANNPSTRKRFLREARAAAKIEHENVLPIHQVFDGDLPYFTMRYLPGGSLQKALEQGRHFSLDELKTIGLKVASALEAAHQYGIIHRDIKPANILLGKDLSSLMVCDFGIATTIEDPALTNPGSIIGTPHYMSPEQASGYLLDGRSDLFSLGSVLFHCATGQPPFEGQCSTSVLQKVLTKEPSQLTTVRKDLPLWFQELLSSLLAKKPGDRIPDARSVVQSFTTETLSTKEPAKVSRSLKKCLLIALFLFVPGAAFLSDKTFNNQDQRIPKNSQSFLFSLNGGEPRFSSLQRAISAAKADDIIQVHASSPITVHQTLTIPEDRPLTIRSATNSPVTFVHRQPEGAAIVTRSSLSLHNVIFQRPFEMEATERFLHFAGDELTIDQCSFLVAGPKKWFPSMRLIDAYAPQKIRIRRSRLVQVKGLILTLNLQAKRNHPIHLEIEESFLLGLSPLATELSAKQEVHCHLKNNFLVGMSLLTDHIDSRLPELHFHSQGNIHGLLRGHTWCVQESDDHISENLSWKSTNDVYLYDPTVLTSAPLIKDHPKHTPLSKFRLTEIKGAGFENLFADSHILLNLGRNPQSYTVEEINRYSNLFRERFPQARFNARLLNDPNHSP